MGLGSQRGFPKDPSDLEITIAPSDGNDPDRPVPEVRWDAGHEPRVVERDPINAGLWRSIEVELNVPDDALGLYDITVTCADCDEGVSGYTMDKVLNVVRMNLTG